MKVHRFSTRVGVLSASVLAACVSCSSPVAITLADGAATTGDPSRRIAVDVFVVGPEAQTTGRTVPALISADTVVIVLARRDGTLIQLDADEGARVEKGQALAQLDDGDSRFLLEQAQLEWKRTQVEWRQASAAVRANRLEYDRQLALFKHGLVSRRDVDQAKYQLESARRDAEKVQVAAEIADARVRSEDERTNIRAPLAGIVSRRYARLGNSIQRGDKLFEVTQPGPLRIRFELSQTVSRAVDIGTLVDIFDSSNGRALGAARIHTVIEMDPARTARTYFGDIIGGAGLTPGMALTIRLPSGAGEANATIPRAAFATDSKLTEGESATVHIVLADGTCHPRTVRVEAVVDDRVQVSSGIVPGDRIVLAPPSQLRPGVSIDVLRETTDY
jgi:RND family efflux transporter MFP subunit